MAAWPDRKYFGVVADTAGRHGLWPIATAPPAGWRMTGYSADRAGCVAFAARAWGDMRPLAARGTRPPGDAVAAAGEWGAPGTRPWRTLTDLFADSVRRWPDAIAISAGRASLTYRDLAARSDRLAAILRALGVGAEDRVALHLGGSIDLVVALLGVLKVGAAYIPLDVRAPLTYRRAAVASGAARLALIRPGWSFRLTNLGCPTLSWSSDQEHTALPPAGPAALAGPAPGAERPGGGRCPPAGPASAACVLFTREPRGTPLGVVVEHSQLIELARDRSFDPPGLAGSSQIAVTSAGSLVTEVWHALATGAHLVVLPTLAQPRALGPELTRRQITMMLAPALVIDLIQQRHPRAFARLGTLCSIGPLAPATCMSILDSGFGGRLFTVHGSAETTMAYAAREITGPPAAEPATGTGPGVPLGRPLARCDLYLLDGELRPVAPGAAGELYVGGARVSRGYLGDPGLTVSRFLPDPFATASRMHATGYRARQRADGAFEYLGGVSGG